MDYKNEFNKIVPVEFKELLSLRNGAALVVKKLFSEFSPEDIAVANTKQRIWELIGLYYLNLKRYWEALEIFYSLYEYMLEAQLENLKWVHKGMPLVWIRDCYNNLDFPVLSKRYQMLTLCEDAIATKGLINPEKGGVYFRLVWDQGMSDIDLNRYANKIYELNTENKVYSLFPEWILLELDQDWITDFPISSREASIYKTHKKYLEYLISKIDKDNEGKILELLAEYMLSCMPGCRTYRRKVTKSTDYDIICAMEGPDVDFRSELGRYFICECKNWKDPADFSAIAKFCRVLDSVKSRFGILFSKKGISGSGKTLDAEREQLKVFQDRGMVIIVVDENDLRLIMKGHNFINLIREKYEKVRLDL